jgi:hypothetical protein
MCLLPLLTALPPRLQIRGYCSRCVGRFARRGDFAHVPAYDVLAALPPRLQVVSGSHCVGRCAGHGVVNVLTYAVLIALPHRLQGAVFGLYVCGSVYSIVYCPHHIQAKHACLQPYAEHSMRHSLLGMKGP